MPPVPSCLFTEYSLWKRPKCGSIPSQHSQKHDEAHNVDKRVGRQMMELKPVEKKKPMKKFVGGQRKAANNKSIEHDPKPFMWVRDYLLIRKKHVAFVLGDQTGLAQLMQVRVPNLGTLPFTIIGAAGSGNFLGGTSG